MHRHVHKVVLHFGSDLGWWLGRQLGSSVLGSSGTSLFKYIFDKEFTSLKKKTKQTNKQDVSHLTVGEWRLSHLVT